MIFAFNDVCNLLLLFEIMVTSLRFSVPCLAFKQTEIAFDIHRSNYDCGSANFFIFCLVFLLVLTCVIVKMVLRLRVRGKRSFVRVIVSICFQSESSS